MHVKERVLKMTKEFTAAEAMEWMKAHSGSLLADKDGNYWGFLDGEFFNISGINLLPVPPPYIYAPFTLPSETEEPASEPVTPETPALRDQFAMAALASCQDVPYVIEKDALAAACYEFADAMLKARGGQADG